MLYLSERMTPMMINELVTICPRSPPPVDCQSHALQGDIDSLVLHPSCKHTDRGATSSVKCGPT